VIDKDNNKEYTVDKDAALAKQHFAFLDHVPWECISPVLITPGVTKDYLNGDDTQFDFRRDVLRAHQQLSQTSDYILAEGTGHAGVGNVVGASNATVASWISAPVVLVANGGLGRTLDALSLNQAYFTTPVAGIVVNRIRPEKYEQTLHYLQKALTDIPLLGCVPERPYLGSPTLKDVARLTGGTLVSGAQQHLLRHYRVPADVHVVTSSNSVFQTMLQTSQHRQLYVCHASRLDVIDVFLEHAQEHDTEVSTLIVTGCTRHPLPASVHDALGTTTLPVLCVPHQHVLDELWGRDTTKLQAHDPHRVATTIAHYEPYLDIPLLLERMERTQK